MKKQIIDTICYFSFVIVMGLATYMALMWNDESLIARLIYEGL